MGRLLALAIVLVTLIGIALAVYLQTDGKGFEEPGPTPLTTPPPQGR